MEILAKETLIAAAAVATALESQTRAALRKGCAEFQSILTRGQWGLIMNLERGSNTGKCES